jgi:hypothetical protein
MKLLRWTMISLCAACVLGVAWRAHWMTSLRAPELELNALHADTAPLWSPPSAMSLAEVRAMEDLFSEWHRVDPAQVSSRVVTHWDPMVGHLLLLLPPALVFPGWLYTRERGRRRDAVLHYGLRAGCGLALGLLASVGLWAVVGGWGPPLFLQLAVVGLVLGLLAGVLAKGETSSALAHGHVHRARTGARHTIGPNDRDA